MPEPQAANGPAATARYAIEEVCSGRRLADLDQCYAPSFVDHVNAMEFHGHEGARKSVALYQRLFADLRFRTEQQVFSSFANGECYFCSCKATDRPNH